MSSASSIGPDKPSALESVRSILRAHLVLAFGKFRLDAVTYASIQDFTTTESTCPVPRQKKPLSRKSTNHDFSVLRRLIVLAKKRSLITVMAEIPLLMVRLVHPRSPLGVAPRYTAWRMPARALIVTPRKDPDLDGAACAIAYAELLTMVGHAAVPLIAGRPDGEARFAISEVGWTPPAMPTDSGGFVLVDASELLGLPEGLDPLRVVEVIDHRINDQAGLYFPSARIQIEAVGAAATLISERFAAAGLAPTARSALLLQAAIHSNTQLLNGSVTTPRDEHAAAALAVVASLPTDFVARQFTARRADVLTDLHAAVRRELKHFEDRDGSYQISQLEYPGATDDTTAAAAIVAAMPPRTMLNLVDPLYPRSTIIVADPTFRAWVAARTGFVFDGVASRPHMTFLRKQIVARIAGGMR